MDTNLKQVVSMLVGEDKITLFTKAGEVLVMPLEGPHDTTAIGEFLAPQLTGTTAIQIDLNKYLSLNDALTTEYESEGLPITYMVDGKEIQGIFYPQKVKVQVGEPGNEVTIPKVEKLKRHMKRAADDNSPAVRNFLRRLAPVAKERLHSAEDLMDFIERSELPLTNDGLIIGYKRVDKTDGGYFVDCHSHKIKQRLGSRVWMDIDGVDPSRNKSCSHGLHVANLGYLSGFSGSHTLIVLVDPADFIAVPYGETNKCRVCAYNIIGVMSSKSHKIVCSGDHVEGDHTLETVIAQAVEGNYVKPFERIKVGHKEILEVTPMGEQPISDVVTETSKAQSKPSGKSLNTDKQTDERKQKDIRKMASKTNGRNAWDSAPSNVMTVFEEMRTSQDSKSAIAARNNTSTRTMGRWEDKYDYTGYVASKEASMTIGQHARQMFVNGAYEALDAFKRTKKKSYTALGFTSKEEKTILGALSS